MVSFIPLLWATLRNVRPSLVVESGVFNGHTSWLIHKATQEWNPVLAFVDPYKKGWEHSNAPGRKIHDFRGETFKDFAEIDWNSVQVDRSHALVFFDDHMDQLRRLKEAQALGFGHAMFDDNYIAGVGDMFSIKDACDKDGKVREAFRRKDFPSRRCDNFHHKCETFSEDQARVAFDEFDALTDIYWEGPPLTELFTPYASIWRLMDKQIYEGPFNKDWRGPKIHNRLIVESSKPPLFTNVEVVQKMFKMTFKEVEIESARYVNIVYIKLNKGHLKLASS